MKCPSLTWLLATAGIVWLAAQRGTLLGWANAFPAAQSDEPRTGIWHVEAAVEPMGTLAMTSTKPGSVFSKRAEGAITAVTVSGRGQTPSPATTLSLKQSGTRPAKPLTQQVIQARQADAKRYIIAINRAEQAFFDEEKRFAANVKELGLWVQPKTQFYRYYLFLLSGPRSGRPTLAKALWSLALPKQPNLKSYIGIVWAGKVVQIPEATSLASLCESDQPTTHMPPAPTFVSGKDAPVAHCPKGFAALHR